MRFNYNVKIVSEFDAIAVRFCLVVYESSCSVSPLGINSLKGHLLGFPTIWTGIHNVLHLSDFHHQISDGFYAVEWLFSI